MLSVGKLSEQLRGGNVTEAILSDVVQLSKNQYLGYFLSNIVLEFLTYFEYVNEEGNKHIIDGDETLSEVVALLKNTMLDPKSLLGSTEEALNDLKASLKKYRTKLSDNVAAIAGYDDTLKMHEYVLNRRLARHNTSAFSGISDEEMAGKLLQFIFEFEDAITINDRVKTIYSQLPVRMSKAKFNEWVENALVGMKGVTVGDLDNYITYLKETYNPSGIPGYGEVLLSVYEALSAFDVLYTDIVNNEVVQPLDMSMSRIKTTLESCVSVYTYTASVINNLLGFCIVLNSASLAANKSSAERFVSVMTSVNERKDEMMLIDETMVEALNAIADDFETIRNGNGQCDGLIEEVKQSYLDDVIAAGLGEVFDELSALYILTSASYFAPLSVEARNTQVVDEKVLIEKKKGLIAYLNEASSHDTRIGKRARIANLLGVMNVIHKNTTEIHRYMLNTLSQCKDEREKTGSLYVLNELLNQ